MISYTLTQILQEIKINKSVVFVFIRNVMICVEKEKIHQKMENRWIYKLFLLKVWTILYSGRDTRVTKDNTKQT